MPEYKLVVIGDQVFVELSPNYLLFVGYWAFVQILTKQELLRVINEAIEAVKVRSG